ncbi:MAG: hypothetical protein IKS55_05150 [Oscillospiraceae bacterium]|nr:hypothetical protein [Oscillospiraceae bacterium]
MYKNGNGIKYYSNNDMSIGHYLEQAEIFLNAFDSSKHFSEYTDINEIIELFNIQQLMNSGVLLVKWDEHTVEALKNTCGQFDAIIGRFFSGIKTDNFIKCFQAVAPYYIGDFWHLFSKYKTYSRVDGNIFIELLSKELAALWPILEYKNIVDYYDIELASFMRTSDQSAELLLDSFLSDKKRKYYFPKALLPSEYESIFESYIESDLPNPNYLNLMIDQIPQLCWGDWKKPWREC